MIMETDIKFISKLSINGEEFADIEVSGKFQPKYSELIIEKICCIEESDGEYTREPIGERLFALIISHDMIHEDFTDEAKIIYNLTVGV